MSHNGTQGVFNFSTSNICPRQSLNVIHCATQALTDTEVDLYTVLTCVPWKKCVQCFHHKTSTPCHTETLPSSKKAQCPTPPHDLAESQHKLMFTKAIKLWHQIFSLFSSKEESKEEEGFKFSCMCQVPSQKEQVQIRFFTPRGCREYPYTRSNKKGCEGLESK